MIGFAQIELLFDQIEFAEKSTRIFQKVFSDSVSSFHFFKKMVLTKARNEPK